ncbi:MAG: hypothetical protein V9E98_10445 [Candidatus Nanopelagicales bacterium]
MRSPTSSEDLAISDNDWLFSITRALGQLAEFVLVWVMLAFPSGRLRSVHDRIIVGCAAFTAFFLWIPTVLLSQTVPLAGPIAACGDSCPENVLLVADNPSLAAAFQAAFRWSGTLLLVATAASLAVRLIRASPLTRRTLAPVLVVSILRTLAVAAFIGSGGSILSGEILGRPVLVCPAVHGLGSPARSPVLSVGTETVSSPVCRSARMLWRCGP